MSLATKMLAALLIVAGNTVPAAPVASEPLGTANASTQTVEDSADTANARYLHRLVRLLRNSASPQDWALAWQLDFGDDAAHKREKGALLRKAAMAAPRNRLVQRMWATAAPDVSGCDAQHPCRDRASALARQYPDDGVGWLLVLTDAWRRKNSAEISIAVSRLSRASRFDDSIGDAFQAWETVFRHHPNPPQVMRLATSPEERFLYEPTYSAYMEATAVHEPSFRGLIIVCDRTQPHDAAFTGNCGRAGRLILRQSSTLRGRYCGMEVLRASGTANEQDIAAARVIYWQRHQQVVFEQLESDDRNLQRDFAADYGNTGSEINALLRWMLRANFRPTPPQDWQPAENRPFRLRLYDCA